MIKRFWILIAVLFLILVTVVTIRYRRWEQATKNRLQRESQVIQTDSGEIEYATMGEGPAVLVLHGLKGGYDQGIVTAALLNETNFEFIAVSRPGYLRTPLETGLTPEEQADALATLLISSQPL